MPVLHLPDGGRLAYREEGSGPPLVLVHGSPGDGRSWARVVPHLKDRFGTLAVDLPGYGGSDPVPDEPRGRAALMGAAVARLIEGCEQPVRVAGHSYGGVVALQAALQVAPGAIESVVLFEPVFFRALQLTDDPALGPATEHFEDYVGRARAGEDGAVRLMIDYWFGKDAYGRLPDPVRSYLDANARCNALDVLSSFNDTATVGRLANLSAPVLVVHGEKSPEIVRTIGRALLKLLPNVRLQGLPNANHAMLDAHPEAVAGLIAT